MKTHFQNREGNKIVVLVENKTGKNGLVFIAHGLAGHKQQPHIQAFARAFLKNDYIVVRWDATNSFGESQGNLINATVTNYYQDFEDVISWAENQKWYQEPFVIVGHSLGGACNILFTNKYPKKVKALAPTSAFISGGTYLNWLGQDVMEKWEKKGYREEESKFKPGIIKKFDWNLALDMKKYELFHMAENIKVPTLLMVGSNDLGTPLSTQEKFYDLIPSDKKEIHIIKGAGHNYRSQEHLDEIENIMSNWAKRQI